MTVRTRFAPSPTGELHIGGARTALFNFLLARGANGKFVLRIDDTDRERSRPQYERQLMEDLRWLGLHWDEGPDLDKSMPVSYRQSERTSFYKDALETLRKKELVYPCFCSEARLETLRKEQLSRSEPPRYDGLCRRLSHQQVARKIDEGEKPCWRFILPSVPVTFHDAVRGNLTFSPGDMGDFVAERSDGGVTYIFASVVDDHLMEITHIVRGDEHVPNAARQQALFEALGWTAPVYAHIPMILSQDRQKLSKRTGSTPVLRYREEGYLPEALTAYLSTLSWTPPTEGSPFSLFSLQETASVFSLSRISTSSPVHDETHLRYWQKEVMRRRGSQALLKQLMEVVPSFEVFDAPPLKRLIDDLLEENYTLPLLRGALSFLLEKPKGGHEAWLPELKETLRLADPWTEEELNRTTRTFMKERGLKGKEFFHPLRLILTGRESGAALTLVMCALGRNRVLNRLEFNENKEVG
ncbi:MAG: glutamate--tRNA ligase [Synergistaceae bacterium]|jgi:glutamyl-tRNA synthetase|nr:glutamate--tRNA ligase [Synergistaceae bacterium]